MRDARLLLAGVAAVYGSNYCTVKLLDEWIGSAPAAATLRFALSLIVLMPVLAHVGRSDSRVFQWPIARDGLEVGVWFALGYVAQALALEVSPAGLQAFLLSLTVVVCPMLEAIFEGKQQPKRVWLAACLSAMGVASLEGGDLGGLGAGAIGLWQPVLFGIGFYRLERSMARHCGGHEEEEGTAAVEEVAAAAMDAVAAAPVAALTLTEPATATAALTSAERTLAAEVSSRLRAEPPAAAEPAIEASAAALALTAWQMVSVLGIALAWLAIDSASPAVFVASCHDALATGIARPEVAAAIFWTGTITTAGCCYAEATAMAKLSSSDAMVIFASEPLWACLFAWLAIGEQMGLSAGVGGALIVSACLVSAHEGSERALNALSTSLTSSADSLRARGDKAAVQLEGGVFGLLGLSPAVAEAIEDIAETVDPNIVQ